MGSKLQNVTTRRPLYVAKIAYSVKHRENSDQINFAWSTLIPQMPFKLDYVFSFLNEERRRQSIQFEMDFLYEANAINM